MAYVKTNWAAGVTPLSEANLDHLEEQYDEAAADLTTHTALDTGVHGAGGDTLATDADIATHAALAVAGTHGSTTAATANKLVHRDASGRAKVVAPGAADDVALKSTVTTDIATHAALDTGVHGAGGDVLATDADIATHAAIPTAHQTLTKEFFVPVQYSVNGYAFFKGDTTGPAGAYSVGNADEVGINFFVPHDFSSITDAVICGIAEDTKDPAAFDIYSHYAANGEDKDTNSETSAPTAGIALTDEQAFELDISGILSSLAANDNVWIVLDNRAADQDVLITFLRFKYS